MTKIITLVSAIKAVIPFISKEETRYYLNGAAFDKGLIVATDGHRLAAIKPSDYDGADAELFIMPGETIKKICAVKSNRKLPLYVKIEKGVKYWAASVYEGKPDDESELPQLATFSFQPIDGTFPDWRRVIPSAENFDKPSQARFNAAYLGEFKSLGTDLTIYLNNDPAAPSLIRSSGIDFEAVGVLMPMRKDVESVLPEWLGTVGKKAEPEQTAIILEEVSIGNTLIARKAGDTREWLIVGQTEEDFVMQSCDEKFILSKAEAVADWYLR